MRPEPEAVVSLANRIVLLKRQLAEAQHQWDAMFSEDHPSSATSTPTTAIRKVGSRGGVLKGSDAGKMLAYINQSPEKDFHPTQISEATGILLDTVRSNLSRLLQKELIEQRGRGYYGALTAREKEVPSEEKTS